MRKKIISALVVGLLGFTAFQFIPVLASENPPNEESEKQSTTKQDTSLAEIKNSIKDIRKQEMSKFISDIKNGEVSVEIPKDFRKQKDNEIFEEKVIPVLKEKLNLSTEEKDTEAIREEIANTFLILRAKELGISTEGKDQDTILEEIRSVLEKDKSEKVTLRKERNIELSPEIYQDRILELAKTFGIETEGKSLQQVMKELDEYQKNKSK